MEEARRIMELYRWALEWTEMVERCMRQLPQEQRMVLESQYAVPLRVPLDEIGLELSRCKSTIYRIKRKALRNIWRKFVAQGVPLFWDDKLEHMCYNRRK